MPLHGSHNLQSNITHISDIVNSNEGVPREINAKFFNSAQQVESTSSDLKVTYNQLFSNRKLKRS